MKQWRRWLAGAGLIAAGAGWIGLQQPAKPPLAPVEESAERGSKPLPVGLPAPVRHYLLKTAGERVPTMDTAMAWGTARYRLGAVWMSARWRAYYVPGFDFYRTGEITWFGRTLATGYEAYVEQDGVVAMGPPLNLFETGRAISQAENMLLWAEAVLAPAALVGERARWERLDESAAWLHFPSGSGEDVLRASFDGESGRLREMTGERHRGEAEKRSWCIGYSQWRRVGGLDTAVEIPQRLVVQWADEAEPYGDLLVDGVVYNVDVSEMIPV